MDYKRDLERLDTDLREAERRLEFTRPDLHDAEQEVRELETELSHAKLEPLLIKEELRLQAALERLNGRIKTEQERIALLESKVTEIRKQMKGYPERLTHDVQRLKMKSQIPPVFPEKSAR